MSLRMCGVKREEGEDGGGQGGGPGSPVAAKGSPKHGADGCTDRSARTGEASVWVGGGCLRFIVSGAEWIWWGTTATEFGKGRRWSWDGHRNGRKVCWSLEASGSDLET